MLKPTLRRLVLSAVLAAFLSLGGAAAAPAQPDRATAAFHEPGHGIGSFPRPLEGGRLGNVLLFEAANEPFGFNGCLWRTDGTPEGTYELGNCLFIASPHFLGPVGSHLVFSAAPFGSNDLWATDGTVVGTQPLTPSGTLTAPIGELALNASGDVLAFVATDAEHGREPWVSDGTPAGTHLLADLVPGPEWSSPSGLSTLASGELTFYAARNEPPWWIWTSDFTAAGTSVGVVLATPFEAFGLSRLYPAAKAGILWITELTGPSDCRAHLWRSDGTMPGTFSLKTFELAGCDGRGLVPRPLGDHLYFEADDGSHGREIWRTDGNEAQRLTDSASDRLLDNIGARPLPLGDGVGMALQSGAALGTELWRLGDGPPATAPLLDLCPGPCSGIEPRSFLTPLDDGLLFFVGNDGEHGLEPWLSDGTVAGTRLLADLCPGPCSSSPYFEKAFPGYVLFAADDGAHGQEMWRVDVPSGEARRLTDFGPSSALQWGGMALGDRLVFGADDGPHGAEPWISDGTVEGTHLLADLVPDDDLPPPGPPPNEPPAAPQGLELQATNATTLVVRWEDRSDDEADFVVEARTPAQTGWFQLATAPANRPNAGIPGLPPATPYTLRVRARNAAGVSAPSNTVAASTSAAGAESPCQPDDDHLCLGDGRFRVQVQWRNQHAAAGQPTHGVGQALAATGSNRSGYFWFFRPDNVELVVKVLDGRSLNGFFWTFYGALSDVEYWITVTDVERGAARTYYNPPGEICGEGDTRSLRGNSQAAASGSAARSPAAGPRAFVFDPAPRRIASPLHPPEPCVEDAETLCLLGGRFRVRVTWDDQHNGGSGTGGAVPFANRTGFFWFFNPANVELVVKVLDGTPVNGKIWVFYGALSDVGYTLEVLDTADGHAARQYVNAPGNICGDADTGAF